MVTESKILKSIFIIQLLSSFLVVMGHFTASALNYSNTFWILALNQLSRYGTVLLTIVTGYITAHYIYLFHSAFLIVCNHILTKLVGDVSWVFTNTYYNLLYLLIIYINSVLFSLLVVRAIQHVHLPLKRSSLNG